MTRLHRCLPLLLPLTLAALAPASADASSRSEVLRTKALLELNDGHYQRALGLLDEAVKSDPLDLHSRFYRGVALSRLGHYARALEALEAIGERVDGQMPRYWHELGYLYYRDEQLERAEPAFARAVSLQPDDAASHYYLGICRYKRAAYAESIAPLERAAALDARYAPSSAYLRGISLYRSGDIEQARSLLVAAAAEHTQSVYAGAITDLLVTIDERREERPEHPLAVRLGLAHDSNVGLFADERSLPAGTDSMSDNRAQLELDAGYILAYDPQQQWRLAYQFFGSSHTTLHDYDVASHSLGLDWQRTTDFGYLSGYYRWRSVSLGGEDYQSGHLLGAVAGLRHDAGRYSLLSLLLTSLSYADDSMSSRDLGSWNLVYQHLWPLGNGGNWHLSAGLGGESAEDPAYSFSSYQAAAGISWPLPAEASLKGTLGYSYQDYPESSPQREDEEYATSLAYLRPFGKHWTLEFTLTQTEHPSTWTSYNYDRNTATLAVRWQR